MVYKGPFDARPKDDIGLGIARIHVNDDVKKRQRLVNQVNGIDDYDNPLYQPLQDTEYNAELYYGVHVTDWLTVRPNLQYIKQPGGVDEVDNALVAGSRSRRCSRLLLRTTAIRSWPAAISSAPPNAARRAEQPGVQNVIGE